MNEMIQRMLDNMSPDQVNQMLVNLNRRLLNEKKTY